MPLDRLRTLPPDICSHRCAGSTSMVAVRRPTKVVQEYLHALAMYTGLAIKPKSCALGTSDRTRSRYIFKPLELHWWCVEPEL